VRPHTARRPRLALGDGAATRVSIFLLRPSQDTEVFLKQQGEERQRLEHAEQKKRAANAEKALKEMSARLEALEQVYIYRSIYRDTDICCARRGWGQPDRNVDTDE